MKKLKITSAFNVSIVILLIISVIYTFFMVKTVPKSIFHEGNATITGIIENCQQTDYNTKITMRGKEKILISYNKDFKCLLGQKIKVAGEIEKASNSTIPNLFNYRKFLYSQNIYHVMNANTITIQNAKISPFYKFKNRLLERIKKYKTKEYLMTFILGNSKELDENILKSYRLNGVSHLLAISGMHITLISGLLLYTLNIISKRKKLNYLITILILFIYMFLVNFTPSVNRAVLLFTCLTIKKIINLKVESIYFLILIFSIYLLLNPFIIFNNGFVFSFVITFFLMMYSDHLKKIKGYFKSVFLVSLIAFLVSIPVLTNSYFEINLLSPLINIIFVPFVSIIVFPLSLITVFIKPLDNILCILINILENLSLVISHIKIFTIQLKHVSFFVIILYYLVIILTINGIFKHKYSRFILLLMCLIIHHNINFISQNTMISFLDVSQGDSTLLSNSKHNILIDTGGKMMGAKIVENKTIPYLKSIGINKITELILTHGDFDHMGEAINLVNNFKVEKVIFNCGPYNTLEKELIKVLDKEKIKHSSCIKELKVDNNKLHFLQTKEYDNENDNSNVIYTDINSYKFLFMGDASVTTEKEILEKYNLPDIDVLKVGHHGSKTSSSKEFIDEINPKYSIISVGKKNRYGHPNKEVLNNLRNSKIFRTDEEGSIVFNIKNGKMKVEKYTP